MFKEQISWQELIGTLPYVPPNVISRLIYAQISCIQTENYLQDRYNGTDGYKEDMFLAEQGEHRNVNG